MPSDTADRIFEEKILPVLTSDALYSFCLRKTRSTDDADEIVQAVSMRTWLSREQLHDPEKARAWVFKTARREICRLFNHRARDSRRLVSTDQTVDSCIFDSCTDRSESASSFDRKLDDERAWEAVRQAMGEIPRVFAETLHHRFLREGNVTEAAQQTDAARGSTMSRTFRGVRMLARRLHGTAGCPVPGRFATTGLAVFATGYGAEPANPAACDRRAEQQQLALEVVGQPAADSCGMPRRRMTKCTERPAKKGSKPKAA